MLVTAGKFAIAEEVRRGVYNTDSFNLHIYLGRWWENFPTFENYEFGAYGVCDSIEQFFQTDTGKMHEKK